MRKIIADGDYFQSKATFNTLFASVIQGGAMAWTTQTASMQNGYASQLTPALLDEFRLPIALRKGSYDLKFVYFRNTDNAQIAFTVLNATPSSGFTIGGTNDLYGTALVNQIVSISFTLPYHYDWLIDSSVIGKNASSSGYKVPICHMELIRTGD